MSIDEQNTEPLGLRRQGRLRMLETLYRFPASSRGELVQRTGLSRPTVSAFAEQLIRVGMVREAADDGECADGGRRPSGRPPARLSLVPGAGYAVGVDIGHEHVRVAVCDLSGEAHADLASPAAVDHAPQETLDLVAGLVERALAEASVPRARLVGLGMGLAAPLDTRTGRLQADGILAGWAGVDPAAELRRRLAVPVTLDNDANVGALGERMFGAAREADDLVYVRLSAGLGAGLILGGRGYAGAGGVAGEIGHLLSDPRGPICRCGNRGCLEAVASPVAVARLLEASLGQPVSVTRLLELVAAGDRGACRAVADAGESIGRAVAGLVNILNPELVLVGGELAATGDVVLAPIAAAIERHSVAAAAAAVRVAAGILGPRAEVLGAAALALAASPRALAAQLP